jgi:Fe-S cluster biogenesis protein NfuA
MDNENKVIEVVHKIKIDTSIIEEKIDSFRNYLLRDGGNIEFVKYEDHIVYVKMLGACSSCSIQDITLLTIKEAIMKVSGMVHDMVVIENVD